jgi:oligoendopeptidase F
LLKNPEEDFEALTKDLDVRVSEFESWRDRVRPDMTGPALQSLLDLYETVASTSARLSAYAYLWFSEDTKHLQARTFKAKAEERLTSLSNRMLFFDLWWQAVDEANAARLCEASGDFRYHLESIRRFKPHTLSEPEEKVINVKNITGRSTLNTLYDVLTNGFTFGLTVDGKRKSLTREQLSVYIRSAKPRLREAAYAELYRVFAANRDVLGELYAALVKDWKAENLDLRKFSDPIAARNLGNDIPDDAVHALLSVCSKNAGIFQEYLRLKARICNIKALNRYHIYAPHPADRKRYRYQDAVRMVLNAYRSFSPRLAELAERVFHERHIDARTLPGKLSGAYCYSVTPGLTPYVLLNYTGEARDVATLAHELGHAVHGMMAADHSVFTFHATLPLAETASVFGERVLSDALMAQETNKGVKQGLLLAQLDDIYATVLRQAYFVLFEKQAHELSPMAPRRRIWQRPTWPTCTSSSAKRFPCLMPSDGNGSRSRTSLPAPSTAIRTASAISWCWPCTTCPNSKARPSCRNTSTYWPPEAQRARTPFWLGSGSTCAPRRSGSRGSIPSKAWSKSWSERSANR